ncbi:MAG: response regulator [Epsilonproteobacteria bacterium]|nr:response regulator [Campylobacterota bacterium]
MRGVIKALIVEDDIINQKLLQTFLKKNPHVEKIYEAYNGLEALEILEKNRDINIVFLDIKMPVMDGIEFLENLKSRHDFDYIPVIVLTTDETRKEEAITLGAFDFIVKPIHQDDINEKIAKALEVVSA